MNECNNTDIQSSRMMNETGDEIQLIEIPSSSDEAETKENETKIYEIIEILSDDD